MRAVCVFCGSNAGARDDYAEAAAEVGRAIAARGLALVYGGAAVGLMGALADAALAAGGKVIGVIPKALVEREIAHAGLTELHEVKSMHERKAHDGGPLRRVSGAARAAPGRWRRCSRPGPGRSSAITRSRSGCSTSTASSTASSRSSIINAASASSAQEHRDMLIVESDPERLLDRFESYRPPVVEKWIRAAER